VSNVWENVAPPAIVSLVKLASSAVTVWPLEAVFVHVTEVPLATVSELGWKAKSTIVAAFAAPAWLAAGPPTVGAGVVDPPPQAVTKRAEMRAAVASDRMGLDPFVSVKGSFG